MSKQCLNKLFFCSCLLLAGLFLQSAAYAKHLLVFGDSLSAAYGMDLEQGWALGQWRRTENPGQQRQYFGRNHHRRAGSSANYA